MASNHHHHHCHSAATAAPNAAVCYCYSINPVSYHLSPPDPHSMPPCFHNHQEQPHFVNPCPNPPYNSQIRHCCPTQPYHQTENRYIQELHHHRRQQQRVDDQPVFSSLLRRIASLESSLHYRRRAASSQSLRDAAARTIQNHFRAFLVCRSITLRQLKELASIKSTFNILKSSASNSDLQSVSHKSKHLLLKLDSIQGGDPMIRDGKNSIRRELIKFIELIDEASVETYSLSSRIVNNVKHGCSNNNSRVEVLQDLEKMESIINKYLELRKSVEEDDEVSVIKKSGVLQKGGLAKRHGGVQPKVDKVVTFAEDGNVFRVSQRNLKKVSDEEEHSIDGDEEELIDNLRRRVEDLGVQLKEVGVDEDAQSEDVGSEPNYSSRKQPRFEKRIEHVENGSFVFSAPLPVMME